MSNQQSNLTVYKQITFFHFGYLTFSPLSGAVTRNGKYLKTASLAAGLRFDFQTGFVSIIRSNSSAQDNVSEWGTTRLSVRPARMQETVS